jgi:putative peptidoglycan lipid II flippase
MLLPQGIFAQAVGTAVFPTFSQQAALGQRAELRATLVNALQMLVALTVPAAVGLVVLGEPIVGVMFERGKFDATSTAAVAWALSFFALGLVGHSALEILGRAFYAMQDTWTPALTAMVSVTLAGVLGLTLPAVFSRLGLMPLGGLALAVAVASLTEMSILLVFVRRRLGALDARQIASTVGRVGLAAGAMGAVLLLWREVGPQGAMLQTLVGVPLGTLAYAGLAYTLRVDQLRSAVRMVAGRAR